jgi:TPP-dependent pyruvate/acetoin dehydrogenase alpha subunit
MGLLTEKKIQEIIQAADREVDESLEYAKSGLDPEPQDIFSGLMAP